MDNHVDKNKQLPHHGSVSIVPNLFANWF